MEILHFPQITNIHLLQECTFSLTLTIFFHGLCLPCFRGRETSEIYLFTEAPYNLYLWSSSFQTIADPLI